MEAQKNYYQILEVTRNATSEEIKRSYRRLAMKYHPDRNPGNKTAEEKFKQVAAAYQVLSDPHAKANYDFYLYHQEQPPINTNYQRPNYSTQETTYKRYERTSEKEISPRRAFYFIIWIIFVFIQAKQCEDSSHPQFQYAPIHFNFDSLSHPENYMRPSDKSSDTIYVSPDDFSIN